MMRTKRQNLIIEIHFRHYAFFIFSCHFSSFLFVWFLCTKDANLFICHYIWHANIYVCILKKEFEFCVALQGNNIFFIFSLWSNFCFQNFYHCESNACVNVFNLISFYLLEGLFLRKQQKIYLVLQKTKKQPPLCYLFWFYLSVLSSFF